MSVFYTSKEHIYDSSSENLNEKINLHNFSYKDQALNNMNYNDNSGHQSQKKQVLVKVRPSPALQHKFTEEDENSVRYLMFFEENREKVMQAYLKYNKNIIEAEKYLKAMKQNCKTQKTLINESFVSSKDPVYVTSESSSTEQGFCKQANMDTNIMSHLKNLQDEKKMVRKQQKNVMVKQKKSQKRFKVFEERVSRKEREILELKMIRSTPKKLRDSYNKQFIDDDNIEKNHRFNFKIPKTNNTESFSKTFETSSTPIKDNFSTYSKDSREETSLTEKIKRAKFKRFNLSSNYKEMINYSAITESNTLNNPLRLKERLRYLKSNSIIRDHRQLSSDLQDTDNISFEHDRVNTLQTDEISIATTLDIDKPYMSVLNQSDIQKAEQKQNEEFQKLEKEKLELRLNKMKLEERKLKIYSKRSHYKKSDRDDRNNMNINESGNLQNNDINLRSDLIYIDSNDNQHNNYISDIEITEEWKLANNLNLKENQQKIKIRNKPNLSILNAKKKQNNHSPNLKDSQFKFMKSDLEAKTDNSVKSKASQNGSHKKDNLSGSKSRHSRTSDNSCEKEYERSLNNQKDSSQNTMKSIAQVIFLINHIE